MTKVEDSVANDEICGRFCGSCPTYKENHLRTGNPVRLFCARGASGKASCIEPHGCNCPKCGVHSHYKLTGDYYCRG
jgi:Protein of unknown function (DUF2769)